MNQKYIKNNDKTTEITQDNLFFDNDIYANEANLPQFNLERLARNAAQQMIQAALEAEVTEFLERGRYDKTGAADFRGYRSGYHQGRTIATRIREFGSESSASARIIGKPINHN